MSGASQAWRKTGEKKASIGGCTGDEHGESVYFPSRSSRKETPPESKVHEGESRGKETREGARGVGGGRDWSRDRVAIL